MYHKLTFDKGCVLLDMIKVVSPCVTPQILMLKCLVHLLGPGGFILIASLKGIKLTPVR